VPHRIHLTPVHINRIGDGLKGVKRNTHRQQDHGNVEMGSCQLIGPEGQIVGHLQVQVEQMVDRVDKKVAVLEIGEQEKVDDNRFPR
jgi:hypothetical protein